LCHNKFPSKALGYGPATYVACSGITKDFAAGVTTTANSGWKGGCTSYFGADACSGFPSFVSFSTSGISYFSGECLGALSSAQAATFSSVQIGVSKIVNAILDFGSIMNLFKALGYGPATVAACKGLFQLIIFKFLI
jgi:hypothetical protein